MAEEEEKKKFNFKKIALFGIGPIALVGIGIGVGAFLFMPTQTPVEQVEQLIEKKLQQAGQLPSSPDDNESGDDPDKVYKDTPSTETFVTTYYTFPDNFTTNLRGSKAFLQISVGVSTQYDETVMENVELHQLALRSEILGVVSEFSVEEIEGKEGRDNLAERIRLAINEKLEFLEGFGGVKEFSLLPLCYNNRSNFMVGSRKLSNDEVEALLGGLETDDEQTVAKQFDPNEVREFTFGSEDLSLLGDYYALRMINEKICRFTRSVFLPMLRIMPRISSFPPEVKSFDEYVESCDSFVSVTNSRIEELRGNCLVVIQAPFISHLTNSYYGGSKIQSLFATQGEFTATEQRIIEIITEGMNESLEVAWKDLVKTKFEVQTREENIQLISFVDGVDTVIVCSFMVQMPQQDPVSFDIVYPLQTLKPISSQLRSRVQNEFAHDDRTWKDRLQNAVLSIPLTLSAELENLKTSLGKLIKSKEGDVPPMTTPESILVKVSGQSLFYADIGKVGSNVAISMKQRVSESGKRMAEEVVTLKIKMVLKNLKVLENIDVMLTVEVGRTEITIRDLLRLNEGSVVELDRLAGDPLDIMVNNTKIAKGEVVMVGERFGVRFGEIVDPEKRNGKYLN